MYFMYLIRRRNTTALRSGIITSPHVIALEEAGYTNVKLNSGSWSDWISYEENSVATEEKKRLRAHVKRGLLCAFIIFMQHFRCLHFRLLSRADLAYVFGILRKNLLK